MAKQSFVYPSSDLDRGRALLTVLGSFWSRIYTGVDQVQSYATGSAMLVAQSYRNLLETVASLSRFDVPLYHTETWSPIVLRKSQRNSVVTNVARFDRTRAAFDAGLVFDSAEWQPFYAFPRPAKMVSAAQIVNKLIFPTLALSENVDYVFDEERNAIVFVTDPFNSPYTIKKGIYDSSNLIDEEIVLWAFNGAYDYDYVFTQFSYALGMRLKTSQNHKDLMNAVFSGLVNGGTAVADLDLAFSAVCGVPVALESDEVVEVAVRDAHGTLIATDKHVYRFAEDATPVVSVGDTLRAGARLVDAVEIVELTSGQIPARVSALSLDSGYLAACFYGDLLFENKEVPLEVNNNHPSGYTYVKFGLGGFPADVERFFDELHARGVAAATAQRDPCFDNPIAKPTRDELPYPGRAQHIYQVADTHKFYRWRATTPAVPETGSYVEMTEREICGPNWETFPALNAFPIRGNTFIRYLAANTGKLYKWVVSVPAQPETGVYEEVFAPPPRNKVGTLAHLLDKRAQPTSEPTAEYLPLTINPLKFIVANILRNNVFLVHIKGAALGQNRLGLYNIRHLRQLLPPHAAMIVIYEIGGVRDRLDGAENLAENVTSFTGMEPQTDVVSDEYLRDVGAALRTLSGTCQ